MKRNLQQENKSYKGEPHANFRSHTITETKTSLEGLSNRMEMTEEKL